MNLFAICTLSFFFLFTGSICYGEDANKRILYLDTFNPTFKWSHDLVSGFCESLAEQKVAVSVDYLALNMHSMDGRKVSAGTRDKIRRLLAENRYDLVVTVNDSATDLFLFKQLELPPETPLLFCAYNRALRNLPKLEPNMTGLRLVGTIAPTLKLGLQLLPQTKTIAVISDAGEDGVVIHEYLRELQKRVPHVRFELLNGRDCSTEEMLGKIRDLPLDSFVVFCNWFSPHGGRQESPGTVLAHIRDAYAGAIFSTLDHSFSDKIIGGVMPLSSGHGRDAAVMAGMLLNGAVPYTLPPRAGKVDTIIDFNELERLGIDASRIPDGAQIVNRPSTFQEAHGREIVVFVIILALLLLGWLFHVSAIRRVSRRALAIYRALPLRTGAMDRFGKILFCHSTDPGVNESCGKTISDIEHLDYETIFPKFQKVFAEKRPMTFDYESGSQRRVMTVSPIPKTLFGTEAIAWLSHDNTELEEARSRAEQLTRQNDQNRMLLQAVLDYTPSGVCVKDADNDFRYLICNPTYCNLVGRDEQDILGRNDVELGLFNGVERQQLAADREIMLAGKMAHMTQEYNFEHSGRKIYEKYKVPVRLKDGRNLLVVTFADITRMNNLVECEQVVNDSLSKIVVNTDFESNVQNVFATLARQLNCDGICIARYHAEQNSYELLNEWRSSTLSLHALDRKSLRRLLAQGDPEYRSNRLLVIDDTAREERWREWREVNVLSLIGAPIFIDNRLWGVLLLGFLRYKRFFSETDRGIMRSMANILALAQQRQRQIESIRQANQEKQLILNNIQIPIWLYDRSGRLLRANTAAVEIFPQNADPAFSDTVLPVISDGNPTRYEYSNGDRAYIIHTEPVCNASGKLINIVKSAVDVTELNEFIENEKIINLCLETLMTGQDIDGAIHNALQLVCRYLRADRSYLLQYDYEAMLATAAYEYTTPGNTPLPIGRFPQTLHSDEPWFHVLESGETLNLPDLSHPRSIEILGNWMPLARQFRLHSLFAVGIRINGKLWGNLGLVYDARNSTLSELNLKFLNSIGHLFELVLARKRSHEAQLAALQQAQDASKAKSFFLASVSHEIRTPLNAVIGFAEVLRDDDLEPATRKEYLNSIAYSGNALLQLINDVLDLSKLEADQMQFDPQKTDFGKFGQEVCDMFRRKMIDKGLSGRIDIPPMPYIFIDRQRMRQVLFNLVGNAVKFTEKGSVGLSATFTREGDGHGMLEIRVADTGPGIPPEEHERLFEPFVQAQAVRGTYTANNGTGLGLSISKRMLEKMGGSITLRNNETQGCTFIIRLAARYEEEPDAPELPALCSESHPPRPSCRVLLVDDVLMNLRVLTALLNKLEIKPELASSGAEALDKLHQHTFDLVLSDLWMPNMDGAELARRIRQLPGCAELPLVALTADVESGANFEMESFDAVMTKPVTLDKLRKIFDAMQNGTLRRDI